MSTLAHVSGLLEPRLAPAAREWLARARAEIARGVDDARFCALLALASRYAKPRPLGAPRAERERAAQLFEGWDPERWTLLDAARAVLVLARNDLAATTGARAIEEAFRCADVGEAQALYRTLALLPAPERFLERARLGARSNMRALFEAIACDTPYPWRHFDAPAFRQLAIKALFVEAPLWRVYGLDQRLDAELARMALDLADERRSAGRAVNPELWMCLGAHGGERGFASIERELERGTPVGRAAAALALARAGERERLTSLLAVETDEQVRDTMVSALGGRFDQGAFAALDPKLQGRS